MKQPRDSKGRFTKKVKKVYATGFKGFNPNLTCRGKQYRPNAVFEEPAAILCKHGMHFCENPVDVLNYYDIVDPHGHRNIIAPVTALADCEKTENKDKCVTTKLAIGNKLTLSEYVDAVQQSNKSIFTSRSRNLAFGTNENLIVASSGSVNAYRIALAGDSSKVFGSGYDGFISVSGDNSSIVVGSGGEYSSIAVSGDYSRIASDAHASSIAISGDSAAVNAAGKASNIAATGKYAHVKASGDFSKVAVMNSCSDASVSGRSSIAASLGYLGIVKGSLGCFLICAEWHNGAPVAVACGKVDGKNIKPNTWYTCKNGKLVEAE